MAETGSMYKRVKDLRQASDLRERRKMLQNMRSADSRDWALNRAFIDGDQWSYYNRANNRVENLPTEDGDKPRYLVRLVSNQVSPGVQAYVAMLTKTKPTIYAVPDSPSNSDRKAAEMGERLFEYWWSEFSLTTKLQTALMHATLSKGYWLITYDKTAGKPFRFTINPEDGQPIANDRIRELFVAELQQQGIDPSQFETRVALGEISVQSLRGEDVWLSPGAKCPEEAEYAICRAILSPEQIEHRYGKRVEPNTLVNEDDSETLSFGMIRLDKNDSLKMVRPVYTAWFPPSKSLPKGRIVTWVEDQDEILEDQPWPYTFKELPLIQWPGQGTDDDPLVTQVRPLQKELNRTLSQVVMHKNLTINPQMLAPVNALTVKLTSEPGAVIPFNPIAGQVPQWRDMPALPPSVFNVLDNIQTRIDRAFNLQAVTRGDVPPNVEAGIAIDLLQEAAVDQVAPLIQRIEAGLARAGMFMAKLAQDYYIEPRLLKIKGPAGSNQVYHFMQADLQGGFTFHAEAGSGLPRTRAGRMLRIKELIQMGVMTPAQAARELELADMRSVTHAMAVDEDHAHREHDKMLHGLPLNMLAHQSWVQALQAGQNPKTGQPLMDQQEAQSLYEMSLVLPTPYENMALHKDVHEQYMKTTEWEALPPHVQQRYIMHLQLTAEQLAQQPVQVQPEAVRTTLHLQGTVGPTAAAAILSGSGVQGVDPQVMTEEPLETNVYDSVDKPDADSAGNDPFTPFEQTLTAMQAEDEHQLKMAEAQAKIMLAQQRLAKGENEMAQANEAHSQSMLHEHETQAEKVRQMRQPKPAPGGGQ